MIGSRMYINFNVATEPLSRPGENGTSVKKMVRRVDLAFSSSQQQ